MWRHIMEETEKWEGERREECAEKPVTRVLLMCNENLHPVRDNRKEGWTERDWERENEEECICGG